VSTNGTTWKTKGGWKHGYFCGDKGQIPDRILITIRHPLSWLPSLWRFIRGHSYRGPHEFKDFIKINKDHPLFSEGENFFIYRWSFVYGYWLWKKESNDIEIVRLEDLFYNPKPTLDSILGSHLLRNEEFIVPQNYCGPLKKEGGRKELEKEWENKEWMKYWTDDLIEFVKQRTDPEIMNRFRYRWDGSYK